MLVKKHEPSVQPICVLNFERKSEQCHSPVLTTMFETKRECTESNRESANPRICCLQRCAVRITHAPLLSFSPRTGRTTHVRQPGNETWVTSPSEPVPCRCRGSISRSARLEMLECRELLQAKDFCSPHWDMTGQSKTMVLRLRGLYHNRSRYSSQRGSRRCLSETSDGFQHAALAGFHRPRLYRTTDRSIYGTGIPRSPAAQ